MEALRHFDSIAGAADAIILSRGNLGLDVAPEKTAVVQKAAINRCNLLVLPRPTALLQHHSRRAGEGDPHTVYAREGGHVSEQAESAASARACGQGRRR